MSLKDCWNYNNEAIKKRVRSDKVSGKTMSNKLAELVKISGEYSKKLCSLSKTNDSSFFSNNNLFEELGGSSLKTAIDHILGSFDVQSKLIDESMTTLTEEMNRFNDSKADYHKKNKETILSSEKLMKEYNNLVTKTKKSEAKYKSSLDLFEQYQSRNQSDPIIVSKTSEMLINFKRCQDTYESDCASCEEFLRVHQDELEQIYDDIQQVYVERQSSIRNLFEHYIIIQLNYSNKMIKTMNTLTQSLSFINCQNDLFIYTDYIYNNSNNLIYDKIYLQPSTQQTRSNTQYNTPNNTQYNTPINTPINTQINAFITHGNTAINSPSNNAFSDSINEQQYQNHTSNSSYNSQNNNNNENNNMIESNNDNSMNINNNNNVQSLFQCEAMHQYSSNNEKVLDLKQGQIINDCQWLSNDWGHGNLYGKSGLFPRTYVRIYNPESRKIYGEEGQVCHAIYDYQSTIDKGLNMKKGELLYFRRDLASPGWTVVKNTNGSEGVVPETYLKYND